jgi:hypothetical protein
MEARVNILGFYSFGKGGPRPKGTGEFIENDDWWLWDDATTPGLMTVDAFEKARENALSADEHSWLRRQMTSSRIQPSKSRHRFGHQDCAETFKEGVRIFGFPERNRSTSVQ